MKIYLTAVENELADAWESHCGSLPDVVIHRGSIFDLRVDAVVSPANSFGFMDGGIDHLYSQRFGWGVQRKLRELIQIRYHGELVVGSAEIVETDNMTIPFVIAAPTMRVPMILRDTVNPYLSARAVMLLVKHGIFSSGSLEGEQISSAVQSIAFPGLGTGIGQVSPNTCAHQVKTAIEEVMLGKGSYPRTWAEAQQQHQLLYTDRVRNLQRE